MASIFFAVKTRPIMRPHRKDQVFKNKSFNVKMIDDPSIDPAKVEELRIKNQEDRHNNLMQIRYAISEVSETAVFGALALTATYFVGSTLREIAVHTAKSRIK
jgi:hypothetical protein